MHAETRTPLRHPRKIRPALHGRRQGWPATRAGSRLKPALSRCFGGNCECGYLSSWRGTSITANMRKQCKKNNKVTWLRHPRKIGPALHGRQQGWPATRAGSRLKPALSRCFGGNCECGYLSSWPCRGFARAKKRRRKKKKKRQGTHKEPC